MYWYITHGLFCWFLIASNPDDKQLALNFWVVAVIISFFITIARNEKRMEEEKKKERHEALVKQEKHKTKHLIPSNRTVNIIKCTSPKGICGRYYLWKDKEYLHLGTYNPNISYKLINIKIEDVIFFNIVGNVYVKTEVTGGGINLPGAIIGGVVAGGAGAVIAGRKKVETTNTEIDERITLLNYKMDDMTHTITLDSDSYRNLLDLIPEKEYSCVVALQNKNNQ